MDVGSRLRSFRGKKSQRQVADDLGITLSAYSKYERNERVPRDGLKVKIADYYKTTVGEIFFGS